MNTTARMQMFPIALRPCHTAAQHIGLMRLSACATCATCAQLADLMDQPVRDELRCPDDEGQRQQIPSNVLAFGQYIFSTISPSTRNREPDPFQEQTAFKPTKR